MIWYLILPSFICRLLLQSKRFPEAKRAGEERSNGKWVSERSEEEMERTKHVGVGEMGVLDENLEMKVMCKRHGVGV